MEISLEQAVKEASTELLKKWEKHIIHRKYSTNNLSKDLELLKAIKKELKHRKF